MILRRPYAFLIKHFRLIHLILFALLAIITYNASTVLNFFKDYITANGNMEILSSNYINVFIYIAPIIIIGLSILIFYLMKYKDKPRLYYIILIIVSILCTGVYTYLYLNIRSLETTTVSARIIRLYRDIARSNFYVLFVMCIPTLIRGLGFDIKKFNFSKDLKELNLSEEDSAEVEVSIDVSSNSLKRTGRRTLRELKYYYVENKFFINIILGTLILILVMVFPFNKYVVNRNLKEGEVLGTSAFNIKVTDSYLTDRKRISKDNSYVILKVSVIGKVNKYSLDLDHFILEGKNNKYVPSQKFYLYFNDIGIGYRNNILDTTSYKDYILVFNINNIDNSINIDFKSKSETIINDLNIHNKNIEEKKVDDALSTTNSDNIKIESNPTNNYKEVYTMMSTAYAGDTITYMGTTPVRDPDGISTIAVDPSIIPLGSKVYIPGYGLAIASDTGGLIKGNRIDLFLNSEDECINWGVQTVSLYLIAYPGEW